MVLLALTMLTPLVTAMQHTQLQQSAYMVPLEMRHGAVRSRDRSSSNSRQLLGAGKVQVMGRCVLLMC